MSASTALTMIPRDDGFAAREELEVVRSAAAGDVAAFERLYRRHVARVHSLVARMLEPELADEVTQDVFVRVWHKLGTFRGDSSFGTWLHRVTVNLVLARRKKLGIRRDRYLYDGEAVLRRAAGRSARAGFATEFEAGIRRLPERARDVFVLHDIAGFKHREIADMLSDAGRHEELVRRCRALREVLAGPGPSDTVVEMLAQEAGEVWG